jgi:hypothetical protein
MREIQVFYRSCCKSHFDGILRLIQSKTSPSAHWTVLKKRIPSKVKSQATAARVSKNSSVAHTNAATFVIFSVNRALKGHIKQSRFDSFQVDINSFLFFYYSPFKDNDLSARGFSSHRGSSELFTRVDLLEL